MQISNCVFADHSVIVWFSVKQHSQSHHDADIKLFRTMLHITRCIHQLLPIFKFIHCAFALPYCHYNLYKHSFVLRRILTAEFCQNVVSKKQWNYMVFDSKPFKGAFLNDFWPYLTSSWPQSLTLWPCVWNDPQLTLRASPGWHTQTVSMHSENNTVLFNLRDMIWRFHHCLDRQNNAI